MECKRETENWIGLLQQYKNKTVAYNIEDRKEQITLWISYSRKGKGENGRGIDIESS